MTTSRRAKEILKLVPLLIRDLVFGKALVLGSNGRFCIQTQYYFLEPALANTNIRPGQDIYKQGANARAPSSSVFR